MFLRQSVARVVLLSLLALIWAGQALGAEPDVSYLNEMPAPAAVKSKIKGQTPLDTAGRLSGAFQMLRAMMFDLSEGRFISNRASPAERALYAAYGDAAQAARTQGTAIITRSGAAKTGPDSPSPTWVRLASHYEFDAALKDELLGGLFTPAFVKRYEARMAENKRELQEYRRSSEPASTADRGFFASASEGTAGVWHWIQEDLARAVVLAVFGAIAASYMVVAFFLSRRVRLWSASGQVTAAKTVQVVHHHTSAARTDPNTGWTTPGSTSTSTSHHEEFSFHDGSTLRALTLHSTSLSVEKGQRVTAVYASPSSKSKSGYVVRVFNHDTGRSATVYNGCRSARTRSMAASFVWTLLLVLAGVALVMVPAAFSAGGAPAKLWEVALAVAIPLWILGGILMRVFHIFGDRKILKAAAAFQNPGIS